MMTLARWDYKCLNCNLITEQAFNESTFVGYCPVCEENGYDRAQLFKKIISKPSMARVVHEHWNMTSGQVVSGWKQLAEQLHVKSEEMSERLGGPHDFQLVDPSDVYKSDEGLDSTHDAHVALGLKESKGRFVFPMKD